jgi:protein-S-isoprenylcysteine O-methyltransferase Ste14
MEHGPLPSEPEAPWDDLLDWIAAERAVQRGLEGTLWRPFCFVIGALLFVVSLVFLSYATGTQGHPWLWLGVLTPLVILGAMVSRAWRTIERNGDTVGQLDQLEQAWKKAQGLR